MGVVDEMIRPAVQLHACQITLSEFLQIESTSVMHLTYLMDAMLIFNVIQYLKEARRTIS